MVEKINEYISLWEKRCYPDGIPDCVDERLEALGLVPSYRRIAVAILKNDYSLQTLGYTPTKSKYYSMLKKIEIEGRKGFVKQLSLF